MNFEYFLKEIIKIKHLSLLGEISHSKLSPPYRLELSQQIKEKVKSVKKAAVMTLFYPNNNNETMLVLILRKTYKGVHSSQVGFPGGKPEKIDINMEATALRETEEEIGVESKEIDIIKELSKIYIPPSNFDVQPFIGISKNKLHFKKQDEEVEDIIEIKIEQILNHQNIIQTKVKTSYSIDVEVPAFKINNHIIWGATAMILSELKDLISQLDI